MNSLSNHPITKESPPLWTSRVIVTESVELNGSGGRFHNYHMKFLNQSYTKLYQRLGWCRFVFIHLILYFRLLIMCRLRTQPKCSGKRILSLWKNLFDSQYQLGQHQHLANQIRLQSKRIHWAQPHFQKLLVFQFNHHYRLGKFLCLIFNEKLITMAGSYKGTSIQSPLLWYLYILTRIFKPSDDTKMKGTYETLWFLPLFLTSTFTGTIK